MNICYIASVIELPAHSGSGTGGATHAFEIANNLASKGHTVNLICRKSFLEQKTCEEMSDKICIYRMFSWLSRIYKYLSSWKILWKIIRPFYYLFRSIVHTFRLVIFLSSHRCDVIYERCTKSSVSGLLAAVILRKPYFLEINDFCYPKILLRFAKKIITPKKNLIPQFAREKVVELQWGANTDLFRPDIDSEYIKSKYNLHGKKVIIHVGSSMAWHGIDDIIESASLISLSYTDIVFVIVGGGNIDAYKKKVKEYNLEDKFIFTGYIDYKEIPSYISAADIALAPYTSELNKETNRALFASPLKIFEYMSSGKPLITTTVANLNNLIKDKETGLIIPPDSPNDIASAIDELLKNSNLRTTLGTNAYREAIEKYSWQKHTDILENILELI